MDGHDVPPRRVRFGVFDVDFASGDVRKRGVRVRLQPQPLRVLELLVGRPGQVVSRDELRERLWPSDTFVDFDHGLNKAVNRLREILGDSADSPRFIETLPKRGYRFIASVDPVVSDDESARPADVEPRTTRPDEARAAVVETPPPAVSAPSRLRGWMALAAGAAVIAVGWLAIPSRAPDPAPGSGRVLLAVLPFANIAGTPDQDYFCDGMTEEMILQLSALRPERLGVIARTSAMHYKGTQKRIDEIARELGVEYLLEGTVRRSGPRVRITARLVRRDDQTPLWSDSVERDLASVLELQREVARRIAASLAVELLPDAAGPVPAPPPDAYEAFLKGRHAWNTRTPAGLEVALTQLEGAVAAAPRYVPAQAALADALNVLPWYGLRGPRDAYPRAMDIARAALTVDDRSAAAHTALAYAYHYYEWDWDAAEREYALALRLNPNYAQARQWLAAHHAEMGRFDLALQEEREAQVLDPQSLVISAAIGWIHYLGRRYPEADAQLRATLARDPAFVPAHLWLGQTLEAMGRPREAIARYLDVRRLAGQAPTGLGELARGYALAGERAAATRLLDELTAVARTRYVEADLFARIHEALDDPDTAIDWLDRGLTERAAKMVMIGVDPQFDRLRAHPRFQAIVTRLGVPAGAASSGARR